MRGYRRLIEISHLMLSADRYQTHLAVTQWFCSDAPFTYFSVSHKDSEYSSLKCIYASTIVFVDRVAHDSSHCRRLLRESFLLDTEPQVPAAPLGSSSLELQCPWIRTVLGSADPSTNYPRDPAKCFFVQGGGVWASTNPMVWARKTVGSRTEGMMKARA